MPDRRLLHLGLAVLAGVLAFDIGTYSYYRGSVVTPFHGGPVSPTRHHFALSNGALLLSNDRCRNRSYKSHDCNQRDDGRHNRQSAGASSDGFAALPFVFALRSFFRAFAFRVHGGAAVIEKMNDLLEFTHSVAPKLP